MYNNEYLPSEWFTSRKRPRSYQHIPPMSRPVSKSFNRISDFIFPDTIHIRLHQQTQKPLTQRYDRNENYSLPVLNRYNPQQRDLIVVERVPFEQLNHMDMLYREQHRHQLYQHEQQQREPERYQSFRPVRRRYSSITDEGRPIVNERITNGLTARPGLHRERVRDRRKRHTTDNAYHSMMRSMLEEDEESQHVNMGEQKYILSYTTTLDPITDSESLASVNQHRPHVNPTNGFTFDEWKRQTHGRVPINGTIPAPDDYDRTRQRHESSSLSSRDSSSDTDITERNPSKINYDHYRNDVSLITASKGPPAVAMPIPAVWERLESDPVRFRHEPDIFVPIIPSPIDTNNQEIVSTDHQINNSVSNPQGNDSTHHVSLCVNDLRTTLYIDEDALNSTKATLNTSNGSGKAVIKTFIDRIIRRLQHFKRSLDSGLVSVRKRNTLGNGPIDSANYRPYSETTQRKHHRTRLAEKEPSEKTVWRTIADIEEDSKSAQPYFLIRPQTALLLPHETAKFKCCFGGDPLPTIVWSHNESRIPEILAAGGSTSSHYRMHKLHDIYYLDIGPVTMRDNGQVKCTIMNRVGREEAIAKLLVVGCASDATPLINVPLNDTTIIEGRPLKLSCNITGLQVIVNWYHNGKLISPQTQSKSDYDNENSIFSLSRCLRTDAGTVECLVKNRFGEARTSCRIDIANDPELDR